MRVHGGLFAGAGTVVVLLATVLPWRSNDLVDEADGLGGIAVDAALPLLLCVLGVLLGCAATALTARGARVPSLTLAVLAAATVVTAVAAVPLRDVRAIGVDGQGRTVEPEATDVLATGAWVAVAGAVVLLVAGAAALLPSRRR